MSRGTWSLNHGPLRGLYRDRENGWIFGVCSGLADRFNFRVGTLRTISIVSLLLFFWPTTLAYIGATLLLKEKPLIYSGRRHESDFWREQRRRDRWSHS